MSLVFFDVAIAISSKKHLADNPLQRSPQLINFIVELLWTGTKRSVPNKPERTSRHETHVASVHVLQGSHGELKNLFLPYRRNLDLHCYAWFWRVLPVLYQRKRMLQCLLFILHITCYNLSQRRRSIVRITRRKISNLNRVSDYSHVLPWVMTWNSQRNKIYLFGHHALFCGV